MGQSLNIYYIHRLRNLCWATQVGNPTSINQMAIIVPGKLWVWPGTDFFYPCWVSTISNAYTQVFFQPMYVYLNIPTWYTKYVHATFVPLGKCVMIHCRNVKRLKPISVPQLMFIVHLKVSWRVIGLIWVIFLGSCSHEDPSCSSYGLLFRNTDLFASPLCLSHMLL